MSKRKHTKKSKSKSQSQSKSQWSRKKWKKVLDRPGTTVLKLGIKDEFLPDGSIHRWFTPGPTIVSMGKVPYSAIPDPEINLGNLWKMLGFKHSCEATPGTSPGVYHHTFTDNTRPWWTFRETDSGT